MDRPDKALNEDSLRVCLRQDLATKHRDEPDTVLIDELGICQGSARVDLAVVNGQLHAYEIKSARDTLRRLAVQAPLYSKVFERVTLVCAERHVARALGAVPSWWEVLRIIPGRQRPRFERVRRGRQNPRRDVRAVVELLWLEEAVSVLARHDVLRGLRGKPRATLWDKICAVLATEEIDEVVRAHLKATAKKRGRLAQPS